MFRGIFQEDEGFITQPWVDLGIALYSGEGQLKGVSANVGNWNSIHSGPSGSELNDNAWYEADFYGSVTFTFGKFKPGALFTSYTSPNNGFNTVHELAAVFAVDDSGNKLPLSPKVILAFELSGQADAGENKGTYLELGIRPSIKLGKSPATLSIPVKLGLSMQRLLRAPGRQRHVRLLRYRLHRRRGAADQGQGHVGAPRRRRSPVVREQPEASEPRRRLQGRRHVGLQHHVLTADSAGLPGRGRRVASRDSGHGVRNDET